MKKILLVGAITGAAIYVANKALKKNKEELHNKINNAETTEEKVEILESEINKANKVEHINNILFAYSIVVTNLSILVLAEKVIKMYKNFSVLDDVLEPGKKYYLDEIIEILREHNFYIYV